MSVMYFPENTILQYYFLVLLASLSRLRRYKCLCSNVYVCKCSRGRRIKVANSFNQVKILSLVFGLKHGDLYFGKSTYLS